jgi:hypothetical protein
MKPADNGLGGMVRQAIDYTHGIEFGFTVRLVLRERF